jgi:hypothetical protein
MCILHIFGPRAFKYIFIGPSEDSRGPIGSLRRLMGFDNQGAPTRLVNGFEEGPTPRQASKFGPNAVIETHVARPFKERATTVKSYAVDLTGRGGSFCRSVFINESLLGSGVASVRTRLPRS